MPRLAILNLLIGFTIVTISASGGIFVAFDLTEIFVRESGDPNSWYQILARSAHGHFNLFGFLHIMFGLSLSYSPLTFKVKRVQTMGLVLASLAMGPGLLWRGFLGPTESFDLNGVVIGLGSGCGLLALASHAAGLGMKYLDRG